VEIFSRYTALPVKIDDVVAQIVAFGIEDRITYVGVDLDVGILRGYFLRFSERPGVYADPVYRAEIYYEKNQGADWQRLVVCKELIHLFDVDGALTKTQEELDHLMEMIAISPELQFQKDDGFKVLTDKLATLYAISILFPKKARDALIEPYHQDLISAEDIARTAEIPEKYIRLAMLDGWNEIYTTLTSK
jgi:Zn-dependent peptidase ImmA (M78 family)